MTEKDDFARLLVPKVYWEGTKNPCTISVGMIKLCPPPVYAHEILWDTLEETEDGFIVSLRSMTYEEYEERIAELSEE